MFIKRIGLSLLMLLLAGKVYAGDITKTTTFVDTQVLTAAQLNTGFDEIITEVNDLDGDNLASNIAITSSGTMNFSGTTTLATVDINAGAIDGTTIGASSATTAKVTTLFVGDKLSLTQVDGNEYIDSLADGYVDIEATTGIRLRINGTEQVNLVNGILQPTTDNDIDLGAAAKEYKDLYIDGTANIDTLNADSATLTTMDSNGGTMDNVQVDGATTTGMLYTNDASDDMSQLGSQGTVGQVLQSAGPGANPTFADEGMKLLSTTTHAGATNTEDITIAASKKYLVTMDIDNAAETANTLYIRFNSDSTATKYNWAGRCQDMDTTSAVTSDGDDSDGEIVLTLSANGYCLTMDEASVNGFLKGQFFIDTNKVSTAYSAFVDGSFIMKESDTTLVRAEFSGMFLGNETVTSFEIGSAANIAFTIKVYEFGS